jgi:hypothetical protein
MASTPGHSGSAWWVQVWWLKKTMKMRMAQSNFCSCSSNSKLDQEDYRRSRLRFPHLLLTQSSGNAFGEWKRGGAEVPHPGIRQRKEVGTSLPSKAANSKFLLRSGSNWRRLSAKIGRTCHALPGRTVLGEADTGDDRWRMTCQRLRRGEGGGTVLGEGDRRFGLERRRRLPLGWPFVTRGKRGGDARPSRRLRACSSGRRSLLGRTKNIRFEIVEVLRSDFSPSDIWLVAFCGGGELSVPRCLPFPASKRFLPEPEVLTSWCPSARPDTCWCARVACAPKEVSWSEIKIEFILKKNHLFNILQVIENIFFIYDSHLLTF